MRKIDYKLVLIYISLISLAILTILPLWTGIITAFKTNQDLILTSPIFPSTSPTLGPLSDSFKLMAKPLLNSLIITVSSTLLSCLFGSIGAYILTFYKFKGSNFLFILILLGTFVPYQAILIPLILTLKKLSLLNSLLGLIITHSAYGIPICTLFFRSFYREIPESLIMAAKVDGAGVWDVFKRVVLPLSVLPFVVAAVFQFTNIWNDFLFGLVVCGSVDTQPASVALTNLQGGQVALYNLQMAGTMWYILPALIVYLILGKYMIRGFMTGAVKG